VKTSWPRPDERWYLGVSCRKCRSPILFAVDYSEGVQDRRAPPPDILVLTCNANACRHKADYTGAAVSRLQKSPTDVNQTMRTTTNGKSGKFNP
jgi:hypothetical protein